MRRQLLTATLGILVAMSSASAITATTELDDLGPVQAKALIEDVPAEISDSSSTTMTGWSSSPGFAGPLYVSNGQVMVIELTATPLPTAFGFWLQPRGANASDTYSVQYFGFSADNDVDVEFGTLTLAPDGDETFFLGFLDDAGIHSISLLIEDDTSAGSNLHLAIGDFRIPGTQDDQDVIPEPMTMALAGLSLAGLGGYVRRRRRDA